MRRVTAIAVMVLGVASLPGAARADVLWWQMPNDSNGAAPSQQGWGPGGTGFTRAADDFILPVGSGGQFNLGLVKARVVSNLGIDATRYFMEIYADAGGAPGSLLVSRTAYLVDSFGFDNYRRPVVQPRFIADLLLDPGQRYWLSVGGISTTEGAAGFATFNYASAAAVGLPAMSRVGTGAWTPSSAAVDPGIRDFSFSIEGSQLSPPPPPPPPAPDLPAPGAAGALALGAAWALRRRRD